MTSEPPPNPTPESESLSPGKTVLVGLGILAVAGVLFVALWAMEEHGGSVRVPWYLAALYAIGGKWTVGVLLGGLGLLVVGAGIWEWLSPTPKKQGDESTAADKDGASKE
jgi:hypothetical protein